MILSLLDSFEIGMLIFSIVLIVIFLVIIISTLIVRRNNKYKDFVLQHSVALRQLNEINRHYQFKDIPNFDMKNSYDNENFYEDISCRDYLTYQLVYIQKKVSIALRDTLENNKLFDEYRKEIGDTCVMNQYDTSNLLKNRNKLTRIENNLFNKNIKKPTILFSIKVRLILTNINGAYRHSKSDEFVPKEIKDIIFKINQRNGSFYLNNDIWKSICRVERGKVSNKMRFAVYERDHYRCRKCGRKTNDLEVDHIIPIAKGGKSTFDNLQTLCHRCNYEKGAKIE